MIWIILVSLGMSGLVDLLRSWRLWLENKPYDAFWSIVAVPGWFYITWWLYRLNSVYDLAALAEKAGL